MKNVELIGTKRQTKGTAGAQAVRRNQQVPCVLYGGKEPVHFSVEERALSKIVHSPEAHCVELNIDGQKYTATLQAKQFQPVTDAVIHADFLEALPGKEARMNITVRLKGQSAGVRKGGRLSQAMRKVQVKGTLETLPNVIEVDVTDLDIGQSVHVGDIKLPGVTLLEKPENVIASVKLAKKAAAAAGEPAAAAAPEASAEPAKE